jgi:hypothetical protein
MQDLTSCGAHRREGMVSPNRVAGAAYVSFWLKVTDSAPWQGRSRGMAVSFLGRIWLLGGVTYDGNWPPGAGLFSFLV